MIDRNSNGNYRVSAVDIRQMYLTGKRLLVSLLVELNRLATSGSAELAVCSRSSYCYLRGAHEFIVLVRSRSRSRQRGSTGINSFALCIDNCLICSVIRDSTVCSGSGSPFHGAYSDKFGHIESNWIDSLQTCYRSLNSLNCHRGLQCRTRIIDVRRYFSKILTLVLYCLQRINRCLGIRISINQSLRIVIQCFQVCTMRNNNLFGVRSVLHIIRHCIRISQSGIISRRNEVLPFRIIRNSLFVTIIEINRPVTVILRRGNQIPLILSFCISFLTSCHIRTSRIFITLIIKSCPTLREESRVITMNIPIFAIIHERPFQVTSVIRRTSGWTTSTCLIRTYIIRSIVSLTIICLSNRKQQIAGCCIIIRINGFNLTLTGLHKTRSTYGINVILSIIRNGSNIVVPGLLCSCKSTGSKQHCT